MTSWMTSLVSSSARRFSLPAILSVSFAGAALVSPATAVAAASSLIQLQNQLEITHADWHAAESTVSRMPPREWSTFLGLQPDQSPDVQFDNHPSETATADLSSGVRSELVSGIDWRSHNGTSWLSQIENQGKCGSCVAFASIGTMEAQLRIESGYPDFNIKLSPQYLFSCGGAYCDFGWRPTAAAEFLQNYGAVDEACMPYTSQNDTTTSCKKACGDAVSRRVRIAGFSQPTDSEHNLAAIKDALKNGPLVTTMNVYQDFMYYAGGVYKHVSGKRVGSHSISIVGYNDQQRVLIVRNSWGPDWGELGFARISYDDVSGLGDSTWSYRATPFKGVSINAPIDGSYAQKSLRLAVHSTMSGGESLRANVYNSAGRPVLSKDVGSKASLDVSTLGAGRFEIAVQSLGAHGTVLATSQRHYFFISGGALAPAFASASDRARTPAGMAAAPEMVGATAPLLLQLTTQPRTHEVHTQDRALERQIQTLRVQANIGDGELTQASFHYRKLHGTRVGNEMSRTTKHLKNGATVIWKTDGLEAGRYEYWLEAELAGSDLQTKASTEHQTVLVEGARAAL